MNDTKTLFLYADGSGTDIGPVGWAWALVDPDTTEAIAMGAGREPIGTNNTAEMTAVIRGLVYCWEFHEDCTIKVLSDSQYVVNAFRKDWITSWQNRGWKKSNRKPVANKDLWEELITLDDNLIIEWDWVPGHAGIVWNEDCDKRANEARLG